jgi:plastocyanin
MRWLNRLALLSLAASAAGIGMACSKTSGEGTGCKSTNANVTIDANDNQTFTTPSRTVGVGQKVCWQNFGQVAHTVTGDPPTIIDSTTDTTWKHFTGQLTPDLIVVYAFTKGDYPYHCAYHPTTMHGVISVR